MLTKEARRRLPWIILWIALLAIFLDFLHWWASLDYALHAAVCDPTTNNQNCVSYNVFFAFAVSWAYDLNYWGALVTAIATGFIAWFTFSLRDVTAEQARLTQEIINLTRDEFNATHRPKIIAHTCEVAHDNEGTIGAHFTIVNAGEATASILKVESKIMLTGRLTPGVILDEVPISRRKLSIGEDMPLPVLGDIFESVIASENKRPDDPTLRCIGRITYADSDGKKIRKTGFCRRYDVATESWLRERNSDYEYCY